MTNPEYSIEVLDSLTPYRIGWEDPNDTALRVLADYAKALSTLNASGDVPIGKLSPYGALKPIFNAGYLKPGDRLLHIKARSGMTYVGIVSTTGTIFVDGIEYTGASNSLKAAVGSEINGWGNWRHERSGKLLQFYRDQG
jgi:hypothetical protein